MEDYLETHFEVVAELMYQLEEIEMPELVEIYDQKGRGGLWDLAKNITDEFENLHKDRDWNGEWMDELHEFIYNKICDSSTINNKEMLEVEFSNEPFQHFNINIEFLNGYSFILLDIAESLKDNINKEKLNELTTEIFIKTLENIKKFSGGNESHKIDQVTELLNTYKIVIKSK